MLSIRIWRTGSMSLESIKQQIGEEIAALNQVLRLLDGTGATARTKATRRKISAADRRRIAAAQRAKWAKARDAKK